MHDRPPLSIVVMMGIAVVVFALRPTETGIDQNARDFGAVPAKITDAARQLVAGEFDPRVARELSRVVTAIFVHGDFEHLLLNMIMFWPFGVLAARYLGGPTVVVVVLTTGVAGNIVQVCFNPQSPIPIVGASGAITGLEGVYFGLLLRWNLPAPDVWPLAHPIPPMQLGAFAVVGFLVDMYSVMNHAQGVAYGAHLGGFITGVSLAAALTQIYPTRRSWPLAA